MSSGYLLDTNIAIAILINEEPVIHFLQQASKDKMPIYFSAITECEVFSGLKPEEQLLIRRGCLHGSHADSIFCLENERTERSP
jgi:predicted nucleic acid-binding protein